MKGNPKVIDGCNMTCQMLATLSMQYRIYRVNLKCMGLPWLCKELDDHYHCTEAHLDCFLARIFYYGKDPDFDMGAVSGADTLTQIFEHIEKLVYAVLDHAKVCRKEVFETDLDSTFDSYGHVIMAMEKQAGFIEQQMNLMKVIGGEKEYVAERMED